LEILLYKDKEFLDKFTMAYESLTAKYKSLDTQIDKDLLYTQACWDGDFDENSAQDEVEYSLSPTEPLSVFLNELDDVSFEIKCSDFIKIDAKLDKSKIEGHCELVSDEIYTIEVSQTNFYSDIYPEHSYNARTSLSQLDISGTYVDQAGGEYQYNLIGSPSLLYCMKVSLNEGGLEYYPMDEQTDGHIEITGTNITASTCRMLVNAIMFEASASASVTISPKLWDKQEFDDEEEGVLNQKIKLPIRNLIDCIKTHEVIALYLKATKCEDFEIAILYFTKVIEYISQTVVRGKVTDEAQKMLRSGLAINPDANFIKELQLFFVKNKENEKDSKAISLTIEKCCYINEFIDFLPNSIKNKIKPKGDNHKSNHEKMSIIAKAVTSTRNQIAHAKANYTKDGAEVGEQEYGLLAECLKIMAEQTIRWYESSSESTKVS